MFTWGKKSASKAKRGSEPVQLVSNGSSKNSQPAPTPDHIQSQGHSYNERSVDAGHSGERGDLPELNIRRNFSISRSGRHKARKARLTIMTDEIYIDGPAPAAVPDQSKSSKQGAREGRSSGSLSGKPKASSSSGCRDTEAGFKEAMGNQPTATAL